MLRNYTPVRMNSADGRVSIFLLASGDYRPISARLNVTSCTGLVYLNEGLNVSLWLFSTQIIASFGPEGTPRDLKTDSGRR